MTRDEFLARYADRSGVPESWLIDKGVLPIACGCGDPSCPGWRMASRMNLPALLDLGHVTRGAVTDAEAWARSRAQLPRSDSDEA